MANAASFESLPPKYREIVQCLVSDVVTEWFFNEKNSFLCGDELIDIFDLKDDPFTGLPVSDKEYFSSLKEYEKQCFEDRYGESELYYDWMGRDLI